MIGYSFGIINYLASNFYIHFQCNILRLHTYNLIYTTISMLYFNNK